MKKIFTLIFTLLLLQQVSAQSPEKMSYQAVIRNSSDELVINTQLGMQISILQGTESGTAVYVETQTPTSNSNGLIAIEIGTGTTSDNFSDIDWPDGPYFIKTEIDLIGGTTYTITGAIQLLSVPYALHAKTAENISGTIKESQISDLDHFTNTDENDPVFGSSIAGGITALDTANWNDKLDAELDGSVTNEIQSISRTGLTVTLNNGGGTYTDSINTYTAGTGIDITNNIIGLESKHYLGEEYLDGIIYQLYIGSDGQQHGLIVSKTQTTAIWQNIGVTTNATRSWDGDYNMDLMTDSPAKDWITTNFTSDWYLPSMDELSLLWHNRFYANKALNDGGYTLLYTSNYWSSTERSLTEAFYFRFNFGTSANTIKTNPYQIRAVRAF